MKRRVPELALLIAALTGLLAYAVRRREGWMATGAVVTNLLWLWCVVRYTWEMWVVFDW